MTNVRVMCVPCGEARGALAALIEEAKVGDPLAPVTVVVPSNLVGLDVRRALAGRRALANVRFLVMDRLAELVAAPLLQAQGRRPRTRWKWVDCLRTAAERQGEPLRGFAGHPATLRRLAALAADLRGAPPAVRERLERHPDAVVAAAAAAVAEAERAAAGLYDEHDLLEAAARAVRSGHRAADEVGMLVVYLPDRLPGDAVELLHAMAGRGGACAILGLTGDAEVDGQMEEWARMLGAIRPEPGRGEGAPVGDEPRLPGRLAVLPDPEEEVRYAIREVWRQAEGGVPLHRMAILYGSVEHYAALVHDRLEASGIPHNGRGLRRLADSLAGRVVFGALRSARLGWRREAVIDWVTSAPVEHRGREVAGHRWDTLSREAGVVRGLLQWRRAAAVIEASLRPRVEEGFLSEEELGRRVEVARQMGEFVEDAANRFGAEPLRPLPVWARAMLTGLEAWLPAGAVRRVAGEGGLAEAEVAAYAEVVRTLDGVAGLDEGTAVSLATFEGLLREALDAPAERHGKLGEGVFAGSIEEAAGMVFDFVVMVGLAERVFPPQPSDDPLLPERVRRELDGAVPSAAERVIRARRAYLMVSACAKGCLVTAPRVSLRDQRPAQPSRWFLEAASRLHGRGVYARDIERWIHDPRGRPPWLEVVDSFAAWVVGGDVFADLAERDLAEVCRGGGAPWEHPLLVELGVDAGVRARAERARRSPAGGSNGLTGWTGEALPAMDAEPELSASALETLTSCPFRFFLSHELGLREVEKPEDLDVVDPASRGSIVHSVLERFVRAVKERRGTEVIEGKWSDAERALLFEVADAEFEAFERRGLTGRPAAWAATRERLRQDFGRFLDEDERWRTERGAAVRDVELAFGARVGREVSITLMDGRRVRFVGKADRVDVLPGGGLVVTDYKSGKLDSYAQAANGGLQRKEGGWLLQLPIYALAVRGGQEVDVAAAYWFVSEEGRFERVEVRLDEETEGEFRRVVEAGLELRQLGLYPAIPGKRKWNGWTNCQFCPFDRVCPGGERDRLWERLRV
ncbi:PD-(D/E)XK nuclease family protein, partial [Tepidiforma sp.]|uniref:PD-(D/E)XK nuclease family protein n=1 Tax=Tepidiforma sp. TaxID=2682230 RepID=UPI002ADE6DB8